MPVHRAIAAVLALLVLPVPALAQTARALGTVKDVTGKPIKGAVVRALNADAYPGDLSSATDDKGRFAMLGLRTGTWRFVVDAPGFLRLDVNAPVRVANSPPMQFTLARDPGPVPNALEQNVQQRLKEAATLRDAGQLDQALTVYQDIYAKNPRLTSVNLVLADVYQRKAAQAADVAARQSLLNRAIDAYNEVLKSVASYECARGGVARERGALN